MANLDTSSTALTHEIFTLAAERANSDDETAVLKTEFTLEMIYQVRMARRRTTDCSRYASTELQHIAGWN